MPEFLIIELLRNARKFYLRIQDIGQTKYKNKKMAPYWSADTWIDVLAKGDGQKKRFQYCLKPNCPEKLVYFGAIQGHSGKAYSGNARINPALQDNVLLLKDFTKYVYHVGNGKELRSTVRNGLVPGGFSTKTGRHALFFTVVNPMDDEQGSRETFANYQKQESRFSRILGNHLRTLYIGAIYCSLKKEDWSFTKQCPNAVVLNDTLPAEFIQKAICMKTKEKLTQSDAQSFRETGCHIVDNGVPGISLSTVQQQDEQRHIQLPS